MMVGSRSPKSELYAFPSLRDNVPYFTGTLIIESSLEGIQMEHISYPPKMSEVQIWVHAFE